jgi:hypothetical protein
MRERIAETGKVVEVSEPTFEEVWKFFTMIAKYRGFTHKVVNDYAFQKRANGNPQNVIHLISVKKSILTIYEYGVGVCMIKYGIIRKEK